MDTTTQAHQNNVLPQDLPKAADSGTSGVLQSSVMSTNGTTPPGANRAAAQVQHTPITNGSPVKTSPTKAQPSMSTTTPQKTSVNGTSSGPSTSTPRRTAVQDTTTSSPLTSSPATAAPSSGILLKIKQPPRRVERTFVSSLQFNPLQAPDVAKEDAIAQPAKEGGMKRANRGPSRMDRSGSGGAATPEPAHAWIAGASSSASGIELPNGPPDPARHSGRKMQRISRTEPLPLQTARDDPAAKPCIPTHLSSPRNPPPRTRPRLFGLEECPTFYPTWEEFADTIKYIDWVGSPEGGNGKAYGIVKIVPPEGWHPDFVLDQDKFRFRTRLQSLNSLSADARANSNYQEQLQKYHTQQGKARVSIPVIDRRPVDLYQLKLIVKHAGGYDHVCRQRGWTDIARQLGYPPASAGYLATQVKSAYTKIIQPFEEFLARAKEQAKMQSSPGGSGTVAGPHAAHPASPQATDADATFANGSASLTPDPDLGIGNRAAASSDLASTFARDLMAAGRSPEEITEAASNGAGPSKRRSGRKRNETTLTRNPVGEASPPKPKRRRKGKYNPDGTKSDARSSQDVVTLSGAEEQMCEICLRGDEGTSMLLCDECDRGYHMYCLDPPLTAIPKSEWYCPPCLVSTGNDYGFDDGETHSLDTFWKRANLFRRSWFEQRPQAIWGGNAPPPPPVAKTEGDPTAMAVDAPESSIADNGVVRPIAGTEIRVSEDDVEREFWRLVHNPDETVEVEYGADIHSTTHGSALPTLETHPANAYARDPWNLNNLPILPASLLRYIKSNISGMTVPWIYVGMMFSAFCWHNEDHYTYSINYQHFGDTKTWYGVPGEDAEKFEEAMRKVAPDLFETSPDLLFQLVTLMSPDKLVKEGVRVYACDQRANEFVITYPKAYHSGFNQGYNLNEAVNFALPDWIDLDLECVRRYQKFCRAPVFSHDELIITAAQHNTAMDAAVWLQEPMRELVQRESRDRKALRDGIPDLKESVDDHDRKEWEYQCSHCHAFSYLGHVVAPGIEGVACLEHAVQVCGARHPTEWTLRLRFSDEQLEGYLQRVNDKADQPQQWRDRLQKLLISHPRPPLRNLRLLLQEGEKIATYLPEVADLREFVDKANDWVNQAAQLMPKRYGGRESAQVGRRRRSAVDQSPTPRQDGDESMMSTDGKAADDTAEVLRLLLAEVDHLPFDAPEIAFLRDSVSTLDQASQRCNEMLQRAQLGEAVPIEECENVLATHSSMKTDVPQLKALQKYVAGRKWVAEMDDIAGNHIDAYEVDELLAEFEKTDLPDTHPHIVDLRKRCEEGKQWQERARISLQVAHPNTLEDLEALVSAPDRVPTLPELYTQVEKLLAKGRRWSERLNAIWTTISKERRTDADPMYSEAHTISREMAESGLSLPHAQDLNECLKAVASFRHRLLALLGDIISNSGDGRESSRVRLQAMTTVLVDRLRRSMNHKDHTPMPNRKGVIDALECFERMTSSQMAAKGMQPDLTCRTCLTKYHAGCLHLSPLEEQHFLKLSQEARREWKCPLCSPSSLPQILAARKTVPLGKLLSLVGEWFPSLIDPSRTRPKTFFWPESAIALGSILETARRDQESIAKWLSEAPNPLDREVAEWYHHVLGRLVQSPVSYFAPNSSEDVVTLSARALYKRHGLDSWGRPQKTLPMSTSASKAPAGPAKAPEISRARPNGEAVSHSSVPQGESDTAAAEKRKRGKRAKFTLLEERPLKPSADAPPQEADRQDIRCLCHGRRPGGKLRCKRCYHWYHKSCVRITHASDTPDLAYNYVCPPCCIKVEKKYPYAEVKVKDMAVADPDLWLDIRTSLRSENGPISKRQNWVAAPEDRIVLHLTHYSPAVRGDALEDESRTSNKSKPSGASAETSIGSSSGVQASISPQSSAISPSAATHAAQPVHQAAANGSGIRDMSADRAPVASGMSHSSSPPGPQAVTVQQPCASHNRAPSLNRQPSSSTSLEDDRNRWQTSSRSIKTHSQWGNEEFRRGMQNLYRRGVTDAMIDRYFVGWNGKDIVYPYIDRVTRKRTDYPLGPHIVVDADDPEGTRVIEAAIKRYKAKVERQAPAHLQGPSKPSETAAATSMSTNADAPSRQPKEEPSRVASHGGGASASAPRTAPRASLPALPQSSTTAAQAGSPPASAPRVAAARSSLPGASQSLAGPHKHEQDAMPTNGSTAASTDSSRP